MSNSLSAVHPELVAEWSDRNLPLTPDSITFGSNKKVWWKGACGHEWETSVKARSNGEKCPICSGARVVTGINDLSTLKPELASEWSEKNKIKPTEVSIGSHKKVIWKCKLGHKWIATVKSRTINKTGCPYCSHNKVLVGFNDLATLFPEVADEWSDRNENSPTEVMAFANSKAWWKCRTCGYEWNTLISTRSGGSKCPCCSGYTFIKGKNDLKSTHPQIAKEWSEKNYPLQPDEVNAKSRKNVWWHCRKCGNEWKSVINARVKGTVCPVCAEREVLAGYNDLATTDKQVLEEWDYELNKLKPTEVSRNSAKRAWWKCRYGHSWSMKINERTVLNKGCRICEQEYLSLFPALAINYYANLKGLKVELGSDRLFGIPLDVYIPLEQVAIQVNTDSEKIDILKEHLCKQRGIKLIKLPMKPNEVEPEYAQRIKAAFQSVAADDSNGFFTPNEKINFSNVKIEPLFEEDVDFDTFSKSDFRAVKVKECVAVPKSKKLLQFTLDDGTGTDRTILSGIHAYYEQEELVGKTLIAITNLPPRKMMGIESCGMLLSAVNNLKDSEDEELHLIMVDNHIPAGAKLY